MVLPFSRQLQLLWIKEFEKRLVIFTAQSRAHAHVSGDRPRYAWRESLRFLVAAGAVFMEHLRPSIRARGLAFLLGTVTLGRLLRRSTAHLAYGCRHR